MKLVFILIVIIVGCVSCSHLQQHLRHQFPDKPSWTFPLNISGLDYSNTPVTAADEKVVVSTFAVPQEATVSIKIFALAPQTGKLIWHVSKDIAADPSWAYAQMVMGHGTVAVYSHEALYGFDAADGTEIFTFSGIKDFSQLLGPVAADAKGNTYCFIVVTDESVIAIDSRSGKTSWTYNIPEAGRTEGSASVAQLSETKPDGPYAFCMTESRGWPQKFVLTCLSASTGFKLWSNDITAMANNGTNVYSFFTGVGNSNAYVWFVMSNGPQMQCVAAAYDIAKGSFRWKFATPSTEHLSNMFGGIVPGKNFTTYVMDWGSFYAVDSRTGIQTGVCNFDLFGFCNNFPPILAPSQHLFYVNQNKDNVLVFDTETMKLDSRFGWDAKYIGMPATYRNWTFAAAPMRAGGCTIRGYNVK